MSFNGYAFDPHDNPTEEQWRTIIGIETLTGDGYGDVDDELFVAYLADHLGIARAEAAQRFAWFDEWMHEFVYLPDLSAPPD